MMKILCFLLILSTARGQIHFPGEVIEELPAAPVAPPEEGAEGVEDGDLIDALGVDTRQNRPFTFSSSNSNACVTPNGEAGTCQSFASCPAYVSLRNVLNRPSVLRFLRLRICRRQGRSVDLCCPSPNSPPNPPTTTTTTSTNPLLQQECGSTPLANRIFGGVLTEPGEWPWMAAVGHRVGNTFSAGCAGTLITKRHVLSAGHCFAPGQVIPTMVRLGAYDLTTRSSSLPVPPQDFNIMDRRDGGYSTATNENDIIILILDRDATFNDYVQPACLPFKHRSNSFVGEDLVVTGWGRTRFENLRTSDVPMKAVVPVVNTGSCAQDYLKLPPNKRPVIDARSLCAGNGATDACTGDSGGPLHYLDLGDSKYYVVGIVSFGVGCGRPDFPGVYTRITRFLDWIERNTQ